MSVIRLFWLPELDVDKGALARSGLESSLDKLLNLVVRNLNVHDLLLALWTLEPKDVLRSEGNGVRVHSLAHEAEAAWSHFLAFALNLEVSSLASATTAAASEATEGLLLLLGVRSLAEGSSGALQFY